METHVADQIYIDATIERVFAALLEPEDVLEWLDAVEARVAPACGGEFRATLSSGATLHAKVSALEANRRVVLGELMYEESGAIRGPSELSFSLDARDGGVWVLARHVGLDRAPDARLARDWEPHAIACRARLVAITVALKRHVEGI